MQFMFESKFNKLSFTLTRELKVKLILRTNLIDRKNYWKPHNHNLPRHGCKKLPNWDPGTAGTENCTAHTLVYTFHNPFPHFSFFSLDRYCKKEQQKCLCKEKECVLFKFGSHEWPPATRVLKLLTSRPPFEMASLLSASFIISGQIW